MKSRIHEWGNYFKTVSLSKGEQTYMPKTSKELCKRYKIWIINTITLTIIFLIFFATITIYIDPLFHYHKPLKNYAYPLTYENERYQNDGIIRNFEYNSIITGSSMTENFKKTEADQIFSAQFIKVPFSGASYKEINDSLQKAYHIKKNIKYVIRCLDYTQLIKNKDFSNKNMIYPTYLYNDNPFDDVNYVLNKSILFTYTRDVIQYTNEGNQTTTFDDYANWNDFYTYGIDTVLSTYTLGERASVSQILSEDDSTMILENIQQNVTDLVDEHPETIFYLFFPPYSICYWDMLKNDGQVDWRIDAEEIAIKELLKHPNIKLYSFCDNFDLVCNLNNYKDMAHYGEWVNSQILEWMYEEKHQLTEENFQQYLETIRVFYNSYDYTSLRR